MSSSEGGGSRSLARKGGASWWSRLPIPPLVLALAVLVYGHYGFDGLLRRDYAVYLYAGQRVAAGLPPYVGVFDHKGPLSPMIAGLGVELAGWLNWDDVHTVRLVFFATGCLAVVAVYGLGESVFRSRAVGLFAALTFLGFYAYAEPVASGPEPKTPMVLFEALNLLLTARKRWFWGGLSGSLAFLVWQPMAVFPFVTLLLAATRPWDERLGATLRALAGVAAPLVATLAYYWYHGSLGALVDGFVLYNLEYLVRGKTDLESYLLSLATNVALPYATALAPIVVGLGMILRLYFVRPLRYRYMPILLSFPAPLLWSLLDFQLADDFFPFLPYAAVGFGALLALAVRHADARRLTAALACAALLAVSLANTLPAVNAKLQNVGPGLDLNGQRRSALEIEHRFGRDAKVASIGSPQVLVLLHKTNPNPYPILTSGYDLKIAAETPGGFEGWLRRLGAANPDVIVYFGDGQAVPPDADMTPAHRRELVGWLDARYHKEKVGDWWVLVKNSPQGSESSQRPPVGSSAPRA